MIHVEKLTVHEFRGIRDLTLAFNRTNFAICGPNGTGKSGIVDALEFALTGSVSRLTGRGRGDLSVKSHGPHVDCVLPEDAFVEVTLSAPMVAKPIIIRRTVKAHNAPSVNPDTPETRRILAELEEHPEFALSRREVTNYVLAEPAHRAKEVQALLKLDILNDLRLRFQRIAKEAVNDESACKRALETGSDALARALKISQAQSSDVLAAINAQRQILGLPALSQLTPTTSIKDGLVGVGGEATPSLNKTIAASDVDALTKAVDGRGTPDFAANVSDALALLARLRSDESLLSDVSRDAFLSTAIDLYDGEFCPACDAPHAPDEFRRIIEGKRAKLADVQSLRAEAEGKLSSVVSALQSELALLRTAYPHARAVLTAEKVQGIANAGTDVAGAIDQLRALLPLEATIGILEACSSERPELTSILENLAGEIAKLPEPTAQAAALETLTITQERLNTVVSATRAHQAAAQRSLQATKVFEIYVAQTEAALEAIYSKVQERFSELYRQLNADDESAFEAEMKQDRASLNFKVDFYKRGKFPPGAYHSEGHQDSMGLCLYLALMDHLQGKRFTFAVLDDVLMSVDTGHRREVAQMLRAEFPGVQFVLTTHDAVWLKFMQTSGLVKPKNSVHFRKWSVETGPSVWLDADIWQEIEADITDNRIRDAAGALRNYGEYVFGEVCDSLGARVRFNADGRYDLGDLLDPAINRLRELYADALKAAESWGNEERATASKSRKDALDIAAKAAQVEQWQINPAVHFNGWANLSPNDFAPVAAAFRKLVEQFRCDTCGGLYKVVPPKGGKEHLLCDCGAAALSFARKSKAAA